MTKTDVYSWRLSSDLKSDLEEAARREGVSVARLLERISKAWLTEFSAGAQEAEEQSRLRAEACKFIGTVRGGDPHRAERARDRIRKKLMARRRAG